MVLTVFEGLGVRDGEAKLLTDMERANICQPCLTLTAFCTKMFVDVSGKYHKLIFIVHLGQASHVVIRN